MATTDKTNADLIKKVNQANPLELVILAYQGAINFLDKANLEIKAKKAKDAQDQIKKAQNIIQALDKALDMDIEEVSRSLSTTYKQMDRLLEKAAKGKDKKALGQVIAMLNELKQAWQKVASDTSAG